EGRKRGLDRLARGPLGAHLDDRALRIIRIALLAPAHGEAVALAAIHHEGHGLGGFPEGDRQEARGQGIERARMPGLLRREKTLPARDGMRRGHADRLVEDEPAIALAAARPRLLRRALAMRPGLATRRHPAVSFLIHARARPARPRSRHPPTAHAGR